MRIPTPGALLVEHPVVPVPDITGAVREAIDPMAQSLDSCVLSRRDRFRVSLQLTIALQLLVEFDLWPARGAFRDARIVRMPRGIRVTMGRFPYPLSRAVARLGGGEGAMERLRTAALERIGAAVGLERNEIDGGDEEPGLVFEGAVSRQMSELRKPLDLETARVMWALRLTELPLPEVGVVQMWNVPREDSARRLAAALWCRLRRASQQAWIWSAGDSGADTAPMPSLGEQGTLIVAGSVPQGELTALSRWSQREGCGSVVIGTFPQGWRAPQPFVDVDRINRHLCVAGMAPERARRIIDQRRSRFDIFRETDRDALSYAVYQAATPGGRVNTAGPSLSAAEEALKSWLGLSPTGLTPGIVALHSGVSLSQLEASREALSVIDVDGRWRLPEPALLKADPRHLLVAGIHEETDPRHALHMALGNGDSSGLEAWARGELDRLQPIGVRELLSTVFPGELGHPVQLLLAEACLLVFDLYGARAALAGVPNTRAAAHIRWMEGIDHLPGMIRELPTPVEARSNPAAAAETAVIALYDAQRRGLMNGTKAREMIEASLRELGTERQHRIEIELAYILQPQKLDDRRWAAGLAGNHPALRVQMAHRKALVHLERGRTRSARRLLHVLARSLVNPGLLGFVELDLGAVALQEGRSRDAAGHQLRAYRLLRAAGFEHVTSIALFDLAVADIDQLRVRKAEARLKKLVLVDPDDPFIQGEQARLALAVGDERSFRTRLASFEMAVESDDHRFAEGLALLQGVTALLDGDSARAETKFGRAGQEGIAWQALAAAERGNPFRVTKHDEWGVTRAAELLRRVRSAGGNEKVLSRVEVGETTQGLGLALAERVAGMRLPVEADVRSTAIRSLRSKGLTGWAEQLSGIQEHASSLMRTLARIVEHGGVDGVEASHLVALLQSLEVTGIEVLDAADRTEIWRYGEGRAGSEVRHGRLAVIPLGGDLVEGPGMQLVLAILDLVLPGSSISQNGDVEETGFYGVSEVAQALRRELRELGPSHLPVLLLGETGVGKEVAARALHRISGRQGAFVAVNVAAIPSGILEAELFGSVKGAFTGADRSRQGLAATADGGTLFLDEVGDLDTDLQVKLLRFLESGEVRAVGATQTKIVDVRIVSATHANLSRRMREGGFRRDLYFRIAAPDVLVPPLRDRLEDIPILKDLFEREAVSRHGLVRPKWSSDAEAALHRYRWPGNVRELRQVVEVAMVRASGSVVRIEHLPFSAPEPMPGGTWEEAQRGFRRRFLTMALERNHGNRSATARELGISRQALLYHLRKLGLNKTGKN